MLIEFKFGQFTAGVGYLYRNNMSEPEVQPDELMRKFRCVLMFIKMNRFENIAMKYKYALQSSLVNKKGRIMNKWDELKKSSKEVFENFPKIDINNAFIFDILESIVHSAKILKFVDLDDRNLQCEYEEILNSVENSGWSLGKVSIDLETLEGSVIILLNFIYDLSKILPELKSK